MSLITRNILRLSSLKLMLSQLVHQRCKTHIVSLFYRERSIERLEEKKRLLGLDKLPGDDTGVKYTAVVESTAEWKFVERLFPSLTVPTPPKHQSYPTPSGWTPPPEKSPNPKYHVRRNRLLEYPVNLEVRNGQTRLLTCVRLIEGDIWALENDIRQHLEKIAGRRIHSQVHEVAGFIRFKGDYVTVVKEWLQQKGF